MNKALYCADKLCSEGSLTLEEYVGLLDGYTPDTAQELARRACLIRERHYGNLIFLRALVEISNICANNCLYCGIRSANTRVERFELSAEEIMECCRFAYAQGLRTFVWQGGERPQLRADGSGRDNVLAGLMVRVKQEFPDCALTLSLGERPRETYEMWKSAGGDRYLLRHEAAAPDLYASLHPASMSLDNRMRCLRDLKGLGFQTGCGFMVGPPGQTLSHLARDLKFIEEFAPQMVGIGPFIPHHQTPLSGCPHGSVELTCYLLSIIRLICPAVLLPATTALGTLSPEGHRLGFLAGANVVMPNVSPDRAKRNYTLYNGKKYEGSESLQGLEELEKLLQSLDMEIAWDRGDYRS